MFDVAYKPADFDKLHVFRLNPDQLMCLLRSRNFRENARKETLIKLLKVLQKGRRVKLLKERKEVQKVVRGLALSHNTLATI